MEITLGPFDPALHVRSRDHYEAVRREIQLLELAADSVPRRFGELLDRIRAQVPEDTVDEAADRAFLAGEPAFQASVVIPEAQVPAALDATTQLQQLFDQFDRWAAASRNQLFEAPDEVKRYRRTYLAQLRSQLAAAG
ncbi:MAG TPA: hypothetical protein VF995_11280 [Actinomycetota bacterium]